MNHNLSPNFRARYQTYVRPLAPIAPEPEPSWTQTVALLIVFGTLGAAVVANEALNFFGWLR
jgi:hypothetical protein